MLRYTVLRLGLFAGCFAIAYAAFAWLSPDRRVDENELFWALVAGALVSMALSLVLLARQREQISDRINERVNARMARRRAESDPDGHHRVHDADADAEDAEATLDPAERRRDDPAHRPDTPTERRG